MNIEQLIKKYEVRKDLLSNEHDKMLGLQLTPLKAITKLLEDCYAEIICDINSLKQANGDDDKTESAEVCPNCGNPYSHLQTDGSHYCEECANIWQT